jgi:predicted nucleic acid-binding protein
MEERVSKTTFIDTQYVVALVNRRDEHHNLALKLAAQFDGTSLLTTDAVLIEIANTLARRYRSESVDVIGHFLTSIDIVVVRVTPGLFARAFTLYRNHSDKSWGMTDCISFVVMRQAGIQDALTGDRHFNQAGFKALMRTNA